MIRRAWPEWFDWDLELTSHVLRRMRDRGFTEVDLRRMLADARDYRKDDIPGRWIVDTSHDGADWEVVAEPDFERTILVIITAYGVD